MRKVKQLIAVLCASVVLLSGCTMEKRVYMSGYNIEWKGKSDKTARVHSDVKKAHQVAVTSVQSSQVENQPVINAPEVLSTASLPQTVTQPSSATASYTASTSSAPSAAVAAATKAPATEKITVKELKKMVKANRKANKGGGGKSQLIALLLVIFLGGIGIHRFYLGYMWQGVVQLLTLGGCGVWALIDLIRIITGDLQPKDGSYDETL